jgi:putative MATE family efflux protein
MNATSRQHVDLINGPVDSSLRRFAVPMAFSFMVNMVYSLIDRFYASRLGDAAIAAIGSSDQVAFFTFTLASGFGVGTGIIVARRIGEGNRAEAARTATQAVVAMALLAASVTALLYLALPSLPSLLRMNDVVSQYAIQYMGFLFLGFTANLLNFQMFSILRSTGNAVFPMVVLICTTVINAAVAPFLIFGLGPFPEMGLGGAGLATAFAQICGTVVSMWAILSGKASLRLDFTAFRLDTALLMRIARQGIPASLQMLSVSLNRLALFGIVGGFGTSVTAAYTLGLNVDMFVFMSVFAVAMSVEVATGQNIGAGKIERVALFHRSAIRQLSVLMGLLALAVWFFGEPFVRLYTSNPDTVAEAVRYLHTTVFGYLFFAAGLVTVRVFSGAGAPLLSMAITAGGLLGLQLPLAWVLSNATPLAQHGVWIALVVGYALFAGVALWIYKLGVWKNARV